MRTPKLSYKNKYHLALVGSVLIVYFLYVVGIKKTIYYKALYSEQRQSGATLSVSPFEWGVLTQKQKLMNQVQSTFVKTGEITDNELLDQVSIYCSALSLTLKEVSTPLISADSSFAIVSTKLVFGGTFKRVVQLVQKIETNHSLGKIVSLNYHTDMNLESGKPSLECVMYIQSLQNLK